MLMKALRVASHKSPWATWLVTHAGRAARETREFLENCFQTVPETKHAGIRKKITRGDPAQRDATLYEVVAYRLLQQLNFEPEYDPRIAGQRTLDIALGLLSSS